MCLRTGGYELPPNVRVIRLGTTRVGRIAGLLRLSIALRGQYDAVFVHMSQEFLLAAGWLWLLLGKRAYLWRNHYEGSFLTRIAGAFCTKVFYTSHSSYTASFPRSVRMPVGVDIGSARLDVPIERTPASILFLARLDPSKHPEVLLDALGLLTKRGIRYSASIVGGPSEGDEDYPDRLKERARSLGIDSFVIFAGAVPNTDTFRWYRSHELFVNCSKSGMFDKTMFKAAASGCLVLAESSDFGEIAGKEFTYAPGDSADLARKIEEFLALPEDLRRALSERLAKTAQDNRLPLLVERLVSEMTSV